MMIQASIIDFCIQVGGGIDWTILPLFAYPQEQ